jgi:hypothetical protein
VWWLFVDNISKDLHIQDDLGDTYFGFGRELLPSIEELSFGFFCGSNGCKTGLHFDGLFQTGNDLNLTLI